MKNTRKLIPAIAMLLVSAVMMSTASFAWFSTANTAVAEGMQVKATAAGGLAIASYTGAAASPTEPGKETFASSAEVVWTNGSDNTALTPVSHGGGTKWYTNKSDSVDESTAAEAYKLFDGALGNGGYLHTKWQVMALADKTNQGLAINELSIALSGSGETATTEKLNEALRIAINVGTNWFYLAPARDSALASAYNHVKSDGSGTETYEERPASGKKTADYAGTLTFGTSSPIIISDTLTAETPLNVDVYIYYEGEDVSCQTVYANNLKTTEITITFGTVTVTP